MNTEELLRDYNPEMDDETFKKRYSGVFDANHRVLISKELMMSIWQSFEKEKEDFLEAHKNLTTEDIIRIGFDKFVFTMGWHSEEDIPRWRQNKVRVGYCGHCKDQFILMMMQHNLGLCDHCRPQFSSVAIRNFLKKQLYTERYDKAHRDLYMDFFIMFYNDRLFRELFVKGTSFANDFEQLEIETPDWFRDQQSDMKDLVQGEDGVYEVKEITE